MGQLSRKALSVVLSGLLATSMFTALPARAGATEELEPVPMQQEKQPSGNASQASQGTAQMGEDTAPVPANDAQSDDAAAQSDDAAAQSDDAAVQPTELAAQSDGVAAQSEVVRPDFDLRSQGVVTPVKKQDPWCTCWSFAGTAAAESSILTLLKERGQTVDPKDFDLSEKHLAWFGTNPITAAIDSKQAGEGMYVTNSEDTPNITWDNGAYGVNVATLYASGAGPTYEKYFPYQGKEALTERQYLIKHPDVGKATARQAGEEQMGMTLEQAVGQPQDERVQPLLTSLRTNGYLTVGDSDLTVPLLEDALYRYYLEKLVTKNCYTSLDDWTIPETTTVDGQESLSRNVTSEFTLVDGNRLPPLNNRNAEGEWVSINQAGIDAVKSELKKGRGVTVAFKADTASPGEVSENPMMNEDTWAHYSGVDMMTNHQVCIVGWCDSYPASNFLEGKQPPANGAWLVKNSWGSEYDYTTLEDGETINYGKWGIKDESGKQTGYFWLSYYDKTSRNCQSYSFDTDLAEADGQLRVQMYDYMPSTVDAHSVEDTIEQSEGVVKTANVFKNDSDEYVKLASVSTKTASTNATVKYSVYRLRDGSQNPEDGELLGTKTATYEYAGFHRERLDGSIVIKPGETFSVVAEETVESGGKTLHEYATNVTYSKAHAEDVKAKEAQAGTPKNQRDRIADEYGVAVVNKGESFIYDGGTWTDWSEYGPRTSISGDYAIDNFSIKAYLVATSEPTALALSGSGHVQTYGDVAAKASGKGIVIGTTGEAKRLEQFTVSLPKDTDGGIEYRAHLQGIGWGDWVQGGRPCGTTNEARRMEAVQMRLTGALAETHSVWYRVHSQTWGTLGWARDGQAAGTSGQAKRAEAVEVQVLPKGQVPEGYAEGQASYVGAVSADVHLQKVGWTGASSAVEFGTTGQARRLEAVRISAPATPVSAGISYEVHAQSRGWMPAAADGALAGTTGQAKRLEAVRISLTGDAAKDGNYSVWYRVHSQTYGWLGWAHDGQEAGTTGLARRAEAIDVQVLPQGQVPRGYDAGKAACVNG